MIRNSLPLYNRIDKELLEKLNVEIYRSDLTFYNDNEEKSLTFEDGELYNFYLGNVPEYWEVSENDLTLKREIKIENANVLFGVDGITSRGNTLGVGMQVNSRQSNFLINKDLEIEITSDQNEIIIPVKHEFPKSFLRGEIFFEIFIYTKFIYNTNLNHLDEVGVNLGQIDGLKIMVDGDGSSFPIKEVDNGKAPLWELVTMWNDVNSDLFHIDNIRLEMNRNHLRYKDFFKDTKLSKALMFEIMSNVMSQIIYMVINESLYDESLIEDESIADVVTYWIRTYNVDTYNFASINNSLRKSLEEEMVG